MAKGKFAEWLTDEGLLLLQGWARDGLADEQIAKNMGIGKTTFYVWQERFPEIREAIKKGKAPVDFQVENALLKRALGYEYEEVTTEITKVPFVNKKGEECVREEKHVKRTKKFVAPDVTAQIYWLKNRRRGKWCDKPVDFDPGEKTEDDGFMEALSATAAEDWADEEAGL